MPYINQAARDRLEDESFNNNSFLPEPKNAGELNYVITMLIHHYWSQNGGNYQAFNDIIGALEGAKMEVYRKKVAPYEDQKAKDNGEV